MAKDTIIAVISISLGGFIYVFFRQDIIAFECLKPGTLDAIRVQVNMNGNCFENYFLFCIPDALWYLALLLLQFQYMQKCMMSQILLWISIILPFLLEVLQYYGICRGTLDGYDIFSYLIILILTLWTQKQNLSCF